MEEPRIELGRLVRPVGLKGEIKLRPSFDFWPEALDSSRLELSLGDERRPVEIRSSRPAGDCLVLALDGVGDRDAAEAIRGGLLGLAGEPGV